LRNVRRVILAATADFWEDRPKLMHLKIIF